MTTDNLSIVSQDDQESDISVDLPLHEVIGRANRLLKANDRRAPGRFTFEWHDIAFTVTLEQPEAATTVVVIEACLGRLPFTAQDAAARNSAFGLANPGSGQIPGRLKIDQSGLVHLVMRTEPVEADGLAGLLKEVTCRVLENASRLKQLRALLVD